MSSRSRSASPRSASPRLAAAVPLPRSPRRAPQSPRDYSSLGSYYKKLLHAYDGSVRRKGVRANSSLSTEAVESLDNIVQLAVQRIANDARYAMAADNASTLKVKQAAAAVRSAFGPGSELAAAAERDGFEAVRRNEAWIAGNTHEVTVSVRTGRQLASPRRVNNSNVKRASASAKAGLIVPVPRIEKMLRADLGGRIQIEEAVPNPLKPNGTRNAPQKVRVSKDVRVGDDGAIFVAAAIQALLHVFLMRALAFANARKKGPESKPRIATKDLAGGLETYPLLAAQFAGVQMVERKVTRSPRGAARSPRR